MEIIIEVAEDLVVVILQEAFLRGGRTSNRNTPSSSIPHEPRRKPRPVPPILDMPRPPRRKPRPRPHPMDMPPKPPRRKPRPR